jgi:hypothetical protein
VAIVLSVLRYTASDYLFVIFVRLLQQPLIIMLINMFKYTNKDRFWNHVGNSVTYLHKSIQNLIYTIIITPFFPQRYKCIIFDHELTYFILSSTKKYKMLYTENGVIMTLEFIIDNIYVELGRHIYVQQLVLYIKH